MENYIFLYLKTGGGHLAPAKAIAEQMKNRQSDNIEVHLIDGLAQANSMVKGVIEDGYSTSINKTPWVYELMYGLHKFKPISRLTSSIIAYFVRQFIEKQILEKQPQKIIILHFFLIKPVFDILKKHNLSIPVITVVTDPFTAHPIWFLQKNQRFIVFSDELKNKCLKNGINAEHLQVFPFVLSQKFTTQLNEIEKAEARTELGFNPQKKMVLLMGGADGMPRGGRILKHILEHNMNAEIAIVCGNNQKLFNQAIILRDKHQNINLKVYGYIDFVYKLINISDVVITKCGASTFMEILMLGKIPVINNYIWEQEKGNKDYVCNNKMGVFEKKISRLPQVLNALISDHLVYDRFLSNISKADLRNGASMVSNYILN